MSSDNREPSRAGSRSDGLGHLPTSSATEQLLPRIRKVGLRFVPKSPAVQGQAPTADSQARGRPDSSTEEVAARQILCGRITARIEVAGDLRENEPIIKEIFEGQIDRKVAEMWNAVRDQLVYGPGVSPHLSGLVVLGGENPRSFSNGGGDLSLASLDALIERSLPAGVGMTLAFVMNSGRFQRLESLAQGAGLDLAISPDPVLGERIAHYKGIPILVTDAISDTETGATTSVYLVRLGTSAGAPQVAELAWCYNADQGPGIQVDGPRWDPEVPDLLCATLELCIGFASKSNGSVLRLSDVGLG